MEERKAHKYQVRFTPSSRQHFYEILDHLYHIYPLDRAEQIADELEEKAQGLNYLPGRGRNEDWLSGRKHEYRFILYQRTKRADIKIIYYIDEKSRIVYVTDFFPTEMDAGQIADRN